MNNKTAEQKHDLFRECILGAGRVVLISLLGSLLLAPVLGFINYLRSYGLPAELNSVSQTALYIQSSKGAIGAFLDWYNSSMPGYARFGSGIGMIAGAFWAMGLAKSYGAPARFVTGMIAGFLMGARLAMMITSDPPIVIGGALFGALWTSIYLLIAGKPSRFKPLPLLKLNVYD